MSPRWLAIVSSVFALVCQRELFAAGSVERFALVVGSNEAQRSDLPTLKYADDDAVRNHELLQALGVKSTLITSLDPESQAIYPQAASIARPADQAELRRQVGELLRKVAAARNAGRTVELYFWYSGHGGVNGTEVALLLHDGSFTAKELRALIEQSRANYNHVIIDACHARALVGARGEEDPTEAKLQANSEAEDAVPFERWQNRKVTGLLLARGGDDSRTYEWSEYRAGVVSHEIRSALAGAADVTGDRRVTYPELAAFLAAANAHVQERARPRVDVRAPEQNLSQVLSDWSAGAPQVARLKLQPKVHGHLFVQDIHGARLGEIHKAAGHAVELVLLPRDRYFLTFQGRELAPFSAAPGQRLDFDGLRGTSAGGGPAAKGPRLDQAFREGLFKTPYGREFYTGYCQSPDARPCEPLPADARDSELEPGHSPNWLAYGLGGGGALAMGAGVLFYVASEDAFEKYEQAPSGTRDDWRARTKTYDWGATISFIAGGAALAAGSGLLIADLLTESPVLVGPSSIAVRGSF